MTYIMYVLLDLQAALTNAPTELLPLVGAYSRSLQDTGSTTGSEDCSVDESEALTGPLVRPPSGNLSS
jgi:hypothetical protein